MIRMLVVLAAALACLSGCAGTHSVKSPISMRTLDPDAECDSQLLEKLRTFVDASYVEAPLETVIDDLRAKHGLNIVVSWAALEFADIPPDTKVSIQLKQVTLSKLLDVILEQVGGGETEMAYRLCGKTVSISTQEDMSRQTVDCIYNVSDLLSRGLALRKFDSFSDRVGIIETRPGRPTFRSSSYGGVEGLAHLIRLTCDPESWRSYGGNVGVICGYGSVLVVSNVPEVHRRLRRILAEFRLILAGDRVDYESESDVRLRNRLGNTVDANYAGVTFKNVIDSISTMHGVNIVVNWATLEYAHIEQETPVSIDLQHVSLSTLLDEVLESVGGGEVELTYRVADGVITVSTHEDVLRHTVVRLYDVGDLLAGQFSLVRYGSVEYGHGLKGKKEPDSPWETVEVAAFEGADGLVMLINTILEPWSWRMTGGNVGSIYSYGDVLVVDHTVETHRKIVKLLNALRSMLVDH